MIIIKKRSKSIRFLFYNFKSLTFEWIILKKLPRSLPKVNKNHNKHHAEPRKRLKNLILFSFVTFLKMASHYLQYSWNFSKQLELLNRKRNCIILIFWHILKMLSNKFVVSAVFNFTVWIEDLHRGNFFLKIIYIPISCYVGKWDIICTSTRSWVLLISTYLLDIALFFPSMCTMPSQFSFLLHRFLLCYTEIFCVQQIFSPQFFWNNPLETSVHKK